MADEQNAVSSPAIESPNATLAEEIKPIETWTEAEHHEWLKSGTEPRATAPKETPAAEEAETAPESEPGKAQEHKPKAEKRKEQLDNDIQSLDRRAAEIRERLKARAQKRGEVQALEAELAKTETAKPAEQQGLKKPRLSEFDSVEAFEEATEQYLDAIAERKSKAAVEQFRKEQAEQFRRAQAERQHQELSQSWNQRVAEFKKGGADYDAVVPAFVDSEAIPAGSFMETWVLESEKGPALLYHFATNPDELLRIGELSPIAAARELTKLEDQLSGQRPPANPKPKVLPKPPTELHGRATPPGDEITAAVNSGDFASFFAKETAREIAAARK